MFQKSLFISLLTFLFIVSSQAHAKHITGSRYLNQINAVVYNQHFSENKKLTLIMQDLFAYNLAQNPSTATYLGYNDYNDHWQDLTDIARTARQNSVKNTLAIINKLKFKQLNLDNQLNFKLLKLNLTQKIEGFSFPSEWLPINQMGGIQRNIPATLKMMPTQSKRDYLNIIARLKDMPRYIEEVRTLLKKGLDQKITPPKITLTDIPRQIKTLIPAKNWSSPLLQPFLNFPESVNENQRKLIRADAAKIYRNKVVPAWEKFLLYFENEYLPHSRETISLSSLTQGKQWYQWQVKHYTTTALTASQIHQIGLDEVKRIHFKMVEVMKQSKFSGNFPEFLEFLRTDAQFFYTKKQNLLIGYRNIAKKIDAQLPKFFNKLPRLSYGVQAIPDNESKAQTTAYYNGGSFRAKRAGIFFANTYALNTRPKWEMIPLTLHEAVPGHHLQISLAQELDNLPEFRKNAGYSAFVEGWALYAEQLGYPMNLYKDPYDKFGQLTYEMWRAVRLVVDTGIHSMGWSRDQAIQFFKKNSSKSLHDIEVEIDRYIVWPGQALAYKIGELTIQRLKLKAQKQFGDKFDLREFHHQILKNGALPLSMLEQKINHWLSKNS